MNDPTWALHEEAVHHALARNGVADPGEALCALLRLLRDRHRAAAKAFAARAFHEGFELPDPGAATVAEGIRDLAAGTAGRHGGDAEGERGDGAVTRSAGSKASGMQAVADVLGELIALWDFEAIEDAAARQATDPDGEGGGVLLVPQGVAEAGPVPTVGDLVEGGPAEQAAQ